eukprot:4256083-Alexandrium_andersonii.AAC.1
MKCAAAEGREVEAAARLASFAQHADPISAVVVWSLKGFLQPFPISKNLCCPTSKWPCQRAACHFSPEGPGRPWATAPIMMRPRPRAVQKWLI